MKNILTSDFDRLFSGLPPHIQKQTKEMLDFCAKNDSATVHKSDYRLKRVNRKKGLWSIRINDNYRAVSLIDSDGSFTWYWLGPHDEYVKIIK